VVAHLDVTWADTGRTIFNNWLGLIYRLTDVRRGVPFMPTVDRDDPLGLREAHQ
jgi:homoserine O-succinyltransferase/O-acetyltransferase